jgi:hypothetical protein
MPAKVKITTVVIPGKVSIRELYDWVTVKPDYVRVGLPDSPHTKERVAAGKGKVKTRTGRGLTIAQIGAIHEYGAPGASIPSRPFLHPALREGTPELQRLTKILLFEVQSGSITKEIALERLGLLGQRLVQQKIRRGEFAELQPKTIARKKSSKPLIDTGQMIQSVTFAVER